MGAGDSGPASWSRVYGPGAEADPDLTMQRIRAMRARETALYAPAAPPLAPSFETRWKLDEMAEELKTVRFLLWARLNERCEP